MSRRWLLVILILFSSVPARAQTPCASYDADQNWSWEDRERFWFTTQGSRLLPLSWFLALEESAAASTGLFKETLTRFGFISANRSIANLHALPVGFAASGSDSKASVGLTCAACHTTQLSLSGTSTIIEGGPTQADFEMFMRELEVVLFANAAGAKFDRFATRVLGQEAEPSTVAQLRRDVTKAAEQVRDQWNAHWSAEVPSGPGRVDAFGQIYNQVAAYDTGVPGNAMPATAPVSYPFLWNTPQHDVVQWNGSGRNRIPWGPLLRNVGEVLGVFGEATLTPKTGLKYSSSIVLGNLTMLENMLKSLRPPAWPAVCAPLDERLIAAGKKVYKQHCQECHSVIKRTDLRKRFKAEMVEVSKVLTDRQFADNYRDRFLSVTIRPGVLKGYPKTVLPWDRFGEFAAGGEILTNVILGAVIGGGVPGAEKLGRADEETIRRLEADTKDASDALRRARERLAKDGPRYKARPLNGVWATGPFLHNGSVQSLKELLKPPHERRKQFYVGNPEFDFVNVGFSGSYSSGAVLFDATKPGNTDTGHLAGTGLVESEKQALLEYLKVIGER